MKTDILKKKALAKERLTPVRRIHLQQKSADPVRRSGEMIATHLCFIWESIMVASLGCKKSLTWPSDFISQFSNGKIKSVQKDKRKV